MPTISQLPAATTVSATDSLPLSQAGTLRSISVGDILQSAQTAITINSNTLLGRASLGSGGPEQIDIGLGLTFDGPSLRATGSDHAIFPTASGLDMTADLVTSRSGLPELLPVGQLRGLFSAGPNITISSAGLISTAPGTGSVDSTNFGSLINTLEVATSLSPGDLIPIGQSAGGRAVSYAELLGGLTIDQAQAAGAPSDSDTFWVSQNSSLLVRQTLSSVWTWFAQKLTSYFPPVADLTVNTTLDGKLHNGHLLVCSQPLTISAPTGLTGGFACTVLNASSGTITFSGGFVTSAGTASILPWQTATIYGVVYAAGSASVLSIPYQSSANNFSETVAGLTLTTPSPSTIGAAWQPITSSTSAVSYTVLYRVSGSSSWAIAATSQLTTTALVSGLTAGLSYDVAVQASNGAGSGPVSTYRTITMPTVQATTVPASVQGVTATVMSSTSVQVSWLAQSGATGAANYTVQYKISGASTWTGSLSGITSPTTLVSGLQPNTSYDFSVLAANTSGTSAPSAIITAHTATAPNAVSSITWNLPPSGPYSIGSGAIGVNAHVTPSNAAIQFGVSNSSSVAPTSWTAAVNVNTDLWGAYVGTPANAGNYYMWAEGTDGSSQTVYANPFTVR